MIPILFVVVGLGGRIVFVFCFSSFLLFPDYGEDEMVLWYKQCSMYALHISCKSN